MRKHIEQKLIAKIKISLHNTRSLQTSAVPFGTWKSLLNLFPAINGLGYFLSSALRTLVDDEWHEFLIEFLLLWQLLFDFQHQTFCFHKSLLKLVEKQ